MVRKGRASLDKAMPEVIERLKEKLPPFLICQIEDQYRRLMDIPGVGPLVATAAVAIMGDAGAFRSGREFAAYIGLVPKQTGTGGKVRLLGISKRGYAYLRTLFIHGARAATLLAKEPNPWVTELLKRRPTSVAVVGMANKRARTVWALMAHNRTYDKKHVSVRPF